MRVEAEIALSAARYERLSAADIARLGRDLDTAVQNNSTSDYVFWARGIFRVAVLGDIDAAESDLTRSRRINPAYMEAHELEAHLHMMREDYKAAVGSFDLLLQRQTHDPLAASRVFMKAVACYCAQDFDAAVRQARIGADMRPNDRMFHVLAALSCHAAGRDGDAERFEAKADQLVSAPSICGRAPVLPARQAHLAEALRASFRAGAVLRG